MPKYIKADQFFYPHGVRRGGYLELIDGKFGKHVDQVSEGSEIIDYSGYSIAPGLVDTHIHGFGGVDVMDNNIEGTLHTMSEGLLSTGVTSFLPTTLTSSYEQLLAVTENREGVEDFVRTITGEGVTVALGHSNATFEEAKKAVDAGASVWVHAYNGMRGLTHRELGMVGAMYELPHTYAELICDGHHVDPKACDILLKQKGTENIALITDCMTAGGLQDGDYMLGEFPVVVADGTARLKSTGNLAGSILKLKDGLKNVVEWGIANPHEAVMMASFNPAKSVHIDDVCGQIREGYDADFIVLDKDLELVATYLDGEKRYQA